MRSLIIVLYALLFGCAHEPVTSPLSSMPLAPMVPDATVEQVTIDLHADTGFTREERTQIQAAASIWKIQTGGLANINVFYDLDFGSTVSVVGHHADGHDILKRMESWMPEIQAKDREMAHSIPAPLTLGEIQPDVSGGMGIHHRPRVPMTMILVSDRLAEHKAYVQVTTHEFGHLLGLYHEEEDSRAIMWHAMYPMTPVCLKRRDILNFCTANECGKVPMYYCKDQ